MRVMERTAINPWDWSTQFGFNQAELVTNPSKVLVCSGQTAIDGDGNVQHAGDIAGQVNLAWDNLEAVLREAGMTLDDVVRVTAFTTDVDGLLRSGGMMRGGHKAYTLIGISRLAYPELMVELEAIAVA
jgi:enamine deaminase RidA (YjgF/YER057c/UK114 family)